MSADPRTWPLWSRCLITGLMWAGFMYFFVTDGPRTVTQAGIHVVGGLLCGLLLWPLMRAGHRRVFGDLTDAEQETVVRAVARAEPPADPRLREVAIRLARRWRRRRAGTVTHLLLFGAFTVLAVHLAIAVAWWAWFGVAVFPVAGWLSARYEQRLRTSAERFLSAAVR